MAAFGAVLVFNVAAPNILESDLQWGFLSTAMNYAAMFLVFCDLGLSMLVVREVGRDHGLLRRFYANGVTLKIAIGAITLLIGIVASRLMPYRPETLRLVPWFLLSTILYSFSLFLTGLFRGIERMEYEAIMTVAEKIVILMCGLSWLLSGGGLLGIAFIFLGARAIASGLGLFFLRSRIASIRPAVEVGVLRELLTKIWPFAPFAVFAGLYFQLDIFILSLLRGENAVGIYRVAFQLVVVLLFVVDSYSGALMPVLKRVFMESPQDLVPHCQRAVKWMTLVGVPLSLGISCLARPIMDLLYPGRYPGSWVVLSLTAWILILRFLSAVPATLLTSIDRQMGRFYVVLISTVISIASVMLLIPFLGLVACAITTLIVNSFMLIAYWYLAHRAGFTIIPDGRTLRVYLAGGAMYGALYLSSTLGLFTKTAIGAGVYSLAVLLLGVVSRREIQQVIRLFSHKTR